MKKKTINKIITKKIQDWADSIKDEAVKKLVLENTIVTGGCIASMLLQEEVNDFDIYFQNKKTTLAVARYYLDVFKKTKGGTNSKIEEKDDRVSIKIISSGILEGRKEEGDKKYSIQYITQNAITLSHKIQIITRFFGSPEQIHENYDFVHCMNYWTPAEGVVLRAEALECLLTKELRYVGSLYPFCSIVRTKKFIQRHWTINAGQYLKMGFQLSKLDLENLEVLEEQLVGVDTAYFQQIIGLLKKQKKEEADKIDSTYLIEIIDQIF